MATTREGLEFRIDPNGELGKRVTVLARRLSTEDPAARRMMLAMGAGQILRIRARNRVGLDINNRPYDGYSDGYKKFREDHGRPGNPVDLQFSGKMIASFSVRQVPGGVMIGPGAGNIVASHQKLSGIHDSGFRGTVHVKTHVRKVTQAFGVKLRDPVQCVVHGHSMKMRIPKREHWGWNKADKEHARDKYVRPWLRRALSGIGE